MRSRPGDGFTTGTLLASGLVLALVITACSSDLTESEEYLALEAEVSELTASQAETERLLDEVEAELAEAEAEIESVADRLAEVEEYAEELEGAVEDLDQSADDEYPDPPTARTTAEGPVTIFGDGEISCPDHRASDESLPVGTVEFQAGDGEIQVTVTLTDAAADWAYEVELWSDRSCATSGPLGLSSVQLVTDGSGAGALSFAVEGLGSGTYGVNVNISSGGNVPPDPRHREMGTAQFTEVIVP